MQTECRPTVMTDKIISHFVSQKKKKIREAQSRSNWNQTVGCTQCGNDFTGEKKIVVEQLQCTFQLSDFKFRKLTKIKSRKMLAVKFIYAIWNGQLYCSVCARCMFDFVLGLPLPMSIQL